MKKFTVTGKVENKDVKKDFDKAAEDLATWIHAFTHTQRTIDRVSINTFYGQMWYCTPQEPTPKKELHPDFVVEPGEQESFIHAVLHMRRSDPSDRLDCLRRQRNDSGYGGRRCESDVILREPAQLQHLHKRHTK